MKYSLFVPPDALCTDNGVMIAWNGMEKWTTGVDIISPSSLDNVEIEPKTPFGMDLQQDIRNLDIRCKRINLKQLFGSALPEEKPEKSEKIA